MTDLIKGIDREKQNDILYHLTRIKQLPETEIKSGVLSYLASLERIKKDPSIFADGPMLAADFLRSLPAGREEELIQFLFANHAEEAEKLRRVRVMFQDIPYYPQEMTKKIIEELESDDLQKALAGYDNGFVDSILALLPSKKSMMIQNDLLHMDSAPPASQCAEKRRSICERIENEFETQRFNLPEFWKGLEAQASGGGDEYPNEITEEVTSGIADEFSETQDQEQVIQDLAPEDDGNNEAA
jgi:flagellar motor switch protein FliG